jgi:hypothetical protein
MVQFAAPVELHRPQPQPFLKHLRVLHIDAARRIAADIGAMYEAPRKAEQPAIGEHRAEHVDVVQMHDHAARRIRVVRDDDIAFLPGDPLRHRIHRDAHQRRRAAAIGIGEHLALRRHQRDAEILRLLDKGRVRGAQDDPRHLVDHRLEQIGEDLDPDRVLRRRSLGCHPAISRPCKCPSDATPNRRPGEGWDPLVSRSVASRVDPGLRRDDG